MNRSRAIALLASGDKALSVYDGASKAWDAYGSIRSGAETISQIRTGSEIAAVGILTSVMMVILTPMIFSKKG
jgi:hypothetical protein